MGQAASRQATKQAKKLVGDPSKLTLPSSAAQSAAPRPPPLGRPVADAPEHTEDAIKALSERQAKETQDLMRPTGGGNHRPPTPGPPQTPQPDQNSGFYRGQITDPRDVAQERFLIQRSGAPKSQQTPELAPDLLKFLQDVGPLEKRINKEMSSPRLVNELEKGQGGEDTEKKHRLEAARRNRDEMNLVDQIDGYSTPRTTNFFTTSVVEDEADFGLTDLELYDFLKRATKQEPKFCSTYHKERLEAMESATPWTDEEKQEQEKLLSDAMKYLSLPVIVKDDDSSFIGMPQKELDKEFAYQKLDVVAESRVKLVLADLHDLGKKEIRRIR